MNNRNYDLYFIESKVAISVIIRYKSKKCNYKAFFGLLTMFFSIAVWALFAEALLLYITGINLLFLSFAILIPFILIGSVVSEILDTFFNLKEEIRFTTEGFQIVTGLSIRHIIPNKLYEINNNFHLSCIQDEQLKIDQYDKYSSNLKTGIGRIKIEFANQNISALRKYWGMHFNGHRYFGETISKEDGLLIIQKVTDFLVKQITSKKDR
jgi:hypothetical protein